MAISVTIRSVAKQADGSVVVAWGDGSGSTIYDLEGALASLETEATAQHLFLAWYRARSSDLSNPNLVRDKTLTWDLSSQNPIRVQ